MSRAPLRRTVFAAAAALCSISIFTAAGCAAPDSAPDAAGQRVRAIATIYPLAALLTEIGGDRIEVSTLLPPGASPHSYEPVPSDLVRLASADLVVRVGGGLDAWADRLLLGAGNDPRVVTIAELETGDTQSEADGHAAHGHGHSHGGHDHTNEPHLWLDPIFVADRAVPALVDALVALDGAGELPFKTAALALRRRVRALDGRIRSLLAAAPAREYIAFHNAWRHFAARYDLHEAGVVQEAGGEEPTPRELAALITAARRYRVSAILIEPQLSGRVAQIVADEFGGGTVLVDPLGSPAIENRSTYERMMEFNAQAFSRALAGGRS